MRASKEEKHISGAEGIYSEKEIKRVLSKYLTRALNHCRGKPDKIVLTIEKITEEIIFVSPLKIDTYFSDSPESAFYFIKDKLKSLNISEKAIQKAFYVIKNCPLRGATLIDYLSGERLERDLQRGVRVSRIQMDSKKRIEIIRNVKNISPDPERTVEALTIASKVLSCKEVLAEVCISDNPDYTTGYVASRDFGYLRITNIKTQGDNAGGRAFFIKTPCEIDKLIEFLERKPVIVK